MVDKYALESKSSPLLKKILALLAELNKSRQGMIFYNHIKQSLEDWEATQINTVETYAGLINLLLDAFASQLPPESIALAHLKLVQACLTPPHSETELNLLKESVEQAADILKHSCHIDAEELNHTLMPLFERVTEPGKEQHFPQPTPKEAKKGKDHLAAHATRTSGADTAVGESDHTQRSIQQPEPATEGYHRSAGEHAGFNDYDRLGDAAEEFESAGYDATDNLQESRPLKAPRAVLKMLRFPDQEDAAQPPAVESEEFPHMFEPTLGTDDSGEINEDYPVLSDAEYVAGVTNDTEYQSAESQGIEPQLTGTDNDSYRLKSHGENEMERLHRDFVQQMRSIMAENAEFGVHLGLEIDALDDAGKANHIEERRNAILGSLKKLSSSHAELAKKFDTAQTYLSIIESDKQKLSDELDRARMLSLTDDLTSLPNRRAFMRRMDDEVSRVKRYGFPLSLVLIDIDHFKQVNDEYGHAAGDTVLRVYAEKILSVFRHHDMIARYGGEEFAVLLPNTDLEGVLRALDKVKNTVPLVKCKISGVTIAAPTFSAGVAEYRVPETPTQFIERADHALYRAKRLGRNRIEVEQKDHEHGAIDQT